MKLIARAIDGLAGAVISAARILARRSDRMCCSEHAVVVERDGVLWYHELQWNADQWAPLVPPGRGSTPEAQRRTASSKTARVKPGRPRRR